MDNESDTLEMPGRTRHGLGDFAIDYSYSLSANNSSTDFVQVRMIASACYYSFDEAQHPMWKAQFTQEIFEDGWAVACDLVFLDLVLCYFYFYLNNTKTGSLLKYWIYWPVYDRFLKTLYDIF